MSAPPFGPRLLVPLLAVGLAAPALAQPKADPPAARVPVLKPLWKVTTIGRPLGEYIQIDEAAIKRGGREGESARYLKNRVVRPIDWATKLYDAARTERKAAGRPLIPPFLPQASGDYVIYHDNESIAARCLRDLKTFDVPLRPGELEWEAEFHYSLLAVDRDFANRPAWDRWADYHGKPALTEFVWSRTLTHDFHVAHGSVFAVDEMAFLPPRGNVRPVRTFGAVAAALHGGLQWRIEINSGNKSLRIGPAHFIPDPNQKGFDKEPSYQSFCFLSSPRPSGGGVALVCEQDRVLKGMALNPDQFYKSVWDHRQPNSPPAHREALAKTAWQTELVAAPESVVTDTHRRIHAIHLAEADGLIVCPTHLGRVVAVEAKTGKAKWTHEYAPLAAKRFPTFAPEWVVVPPAVADGKYVYAPADFPELLCLNLADGKKVWSTPKGDGLYPVVIGDKVLVVGEKAVRALSLKDGAEVWKLDLPGLPCGRGAVLGSDYLLPVSEPQTWKGMIAVVDVAGGKVREVLKPAQDEPIGNLVVHQDFLISQTLTELAVFPLKKRD